MEPIALREKLHSLIDNSSADKLQEVYDLLQEEGYPDSFKAEFDEELSSYQKNPEVVSKDHIDKLVEQLLYRKNDQCFQNQLS